MTTVKDIFTVAPALVKLLGSMEHNVRVWRYSVLRKPGLVLIKDMKTKIYSTAGIYSSDGYVADQRYIDEDIFIKPPYCQSL